MVMQLLSLPPDATYAEIANAMQETMMFAERQLPLLPRIGLNTKILLDARRKIKLGQDAGPLRNVTYAVLCKAARASMSEDLRRHRIAVLERAITANRLKQGRLELAYQRRQMMQVRRPDRTTTTSTADALHVVVDFYNALYASPSGPFNTNAAGPLPHPITADELRSACARVRGNTSSGADGIPSYVAKHCIPPAADRLATLLNYMFTTNQFCPRHDHPLQKRRRAGYFELSPDLVAHDHVQGAHTRHHQAS